MRKHLLPIFFIFVFCLWSLQSIFQSGFMYSHDSLWHVQRIQNIFTLIPDQFPVRWSPSLDNGFGIPLFNFTYPAPYYLGASMMFLGLGPIKAYYVIIFLAYFFGGCGVYLLGRRQRLFGFVAAFLYLLTPYQLLDIFVRGALGEVVALGIIPWVILSYQEVSNSGRLRWFSPLPMAILLLSHNFFAYLFSGLLAILIIFVYQHRLKLATSYLFSLALSAFFIIPAFFEKSFLLITQIKDYSFQSHFVYPQQLLYSPWSYQGSLIGNNPSEMSFQLGIANILIILVVITYLFYRLNRHTLPRRLTLYTLILIFVIFMTLPPSLWFWHNLPLISSLQFPWRFLGLATILFPLLYLEIANYLALRDRRLFMIFSVTLLLLAFYNTRNYHRPVEWLSSEEFLTLHYEYAGKTTTAHRNELVPLWASEERWQTGSTLQLSSSVELCDLTEGIYGTSFVATTSHSDSHAIYAQNYFPSWHATIDDQPLPLISSDTGEILIPLSKGEHSYSVYLGSTLIAKLSNYLSLLSIIILGMIAWKGKRK